MMTAAAAEPPPGRGNSFFESLQEVDLTTGVSDLFNNIWYSSGTTQTSTTKTNQDKDGNGDGRPYSKSKSRGRSRTTTSGRSKSKSTRSVRSKSSGAKPRGRSVTAASTRSGARSARSRGASARPESSRSSNGGGRPPRPPSRASGISTPKPKSRGLPSPGNAEPVEIDLTALMAREKKRKKKRKRKKKKQMEARRGFAGGSTVQRRNKSTTTVGGGSTRTPKKTHRSQKTVNTTKSTKTSATNRTSTTAKSNKTSGTAKSNKSKASSTVKSIKSTPTYKQQQSSRRTTGTMDSKNSSGHGSSSQKVRLHADTNISSNDKDRDSRYHNRKGNSSKGTAASIRSNRTHKNAPVRHSYTVSTQGDTKSAKSSGSTRRSSMDERRLLEARQAIECRDEQDSSDDDDEYDYDSSSSDDSHDSTYCSSSDDGSSYDSDDSTARHHSTDDNDGDEEDNGETDDDLSLTPTGKESIRSIPLGKNFDDGSSKMGRMSKASKKSHKSRGSAGHKRSKGGIDGTAATQNVSGSDAQSGYDSGSDIDESEFYQGSAGDVLSNKYRIVEELGKGTFGRVLKAYEIKHGSFKERIGLGSFRGVIRPKRSGVVAVKITRNVEKYKKDAEIEANMLRKVNRSGSRGIELFPQLFDEFESPMGHHCVVLEKLGMSLYHVLKANDHQPFSTACVREIAIQVFDALDHLHGIGIIHTDLKPENILLVSNNSDAKDMRIKLIDLGSAEYERNANRHSIVNTRQYRAPEILLRIGWSFPSDVWAAGCTIAELQLGGLLFAAKGDVEHLALIERIIGVFPRWMLLTASTVPDSVAANCFNPVAGCHRMAAVLKRESVKYVMEKEPLVTQLGQVADCVSVADVLEEILCIDPMFRPTARHAKELSMTIGNVQEKRPVDDDDDANGEDEYNVQ